MKWLWVSIFICAMLYGCAGGEQRSDPTLSIKSKGDITAPVTMIPTSNQSKQVYFSLSKTQLLAVAALIVFLSCLVLCLLFAPGVNFAYSNLLAIAFGVAAAVLPILTILVGLRFLNGNGST